MRILYLSVFEKKQLYQTFDVVQSTKTEKQTEQQREIQYGYVSNI